VVPHDFHWTINTLMESSNANLSDLGKRWKQLVDLGKIVLVETDDFWTSGYDYCKMEKVNAKLYQQLSESRLIIFKGDLNYRKLLGDFNWECDTPFDTALKGLIFFLCLFMRFRKVYVFFFLYRLPTIQSLYTANSEGRSDLWFGQRCGR
jgi:ribosomal protein L21